ncbi:MAG TPA: DUF4388 domain-containing protein [Acidobacteriota bacterium]|nr:DUF4388 domain-containing protein [Acidobacteriota bacterium]
MIKEPGQIRQEFSYKGELSQHPLPELLYTIGQYRVPGVITFTQKHACKRLFLRDGRIIFAASNLKDDELGDFLFRCGKITRIQLTDSTLILATTKGKRIGQILVEMGAIPESDLDWAVRSHQQAILWSLFNWFEGSVVFDVGNFKRNETILLDLTISRAILDGIRNITQAKNVIGLVGSRTTILEKEEDAELTLEMHGPDETEREILRKVDGKTMLYDMCANSSHGPHETAKILYALWVLKLVRRKEESGGGIRIQTKVGSGQF